MDNNQQPTNRLAREAAALRLVRQVLLGEEQARRQARHNIVRAVARGIVTAQQYEPRNATKSYLGAQRCAYVQSEVADEFMAMGFHTNEIYCQFGLERYFEKFGKALRVVTLRGNPISLDGRDAVRHRKRGAVFITQVVSDWRQEGQPATLFCMDEFEDDGQDVLYPYEEIEHYVTWFLIWHTKGKNENTEVFVYLARPRSVNDTRTVHECAHIALLGSIKPFQPFDEQYSDIGVDAPRSDEDEGPTFDPDVTPRS